MREEQLPFQFVLTTNSKIYSVSVMTNLEIVVRDLTSNIPGLEEFHFPRDLVNCNEFLVCGYTVCNPWLRQSRVIESGLDIYCMRLEGIGYDEENNYKIIANFRLKEDYSMLLWKIYDLASDTWKDYKSVSGEVTWGQKEGGFKLEDESVSLNGTLYWLASSLSMTNEDNLLIVSFHFPKEKFEAFCELPCVKNHCRDALVLGGLKGDRFTLLKQCFATKKIEIWVTKNKISWDRGKEVAWMSLMQVSIPNFPDLVEIGPYDLQMQPSYFIDSEKRLVVCSWDATGRAWIYVVAENTLISRTRIDSVVDLWPSHCTCFPSLVSVPSNCDRCGQLGHKESGCLHLTIPDLAPTTVTSPKEDVGAPDIAPLNVTTRPIGSSLDTDISLPHVEAPLPINYYNSKKAL